MKKTLLAVAAAAMLLASVAFAQDAHLAQHDYVANGVYQGCRGCHIPHGGSITDSHYANRDTVFGTGGVNNPSTGAFKLWDKNISSAGYETYSSDNVTGELMTLSSTTAAASHSYLCLSCHDGTMATINLPSGVSAAFDPAALIVDPATSDFDLTNDHPVDIAWPVGNKATDGDMYDTPTNVIAGTTGYDTQPLPLYTASNYMECSTCHDPHEQVQSIPTGMRGNFLRLDTADFNNYNLCRACHLGKR